MISQTWIIGKAIRALFADRVTYGQDKCCSSTGVLDYKKTIACICLIIQLVINITIWFVRPLEAPPTFKYTYHQNHEKAIISVIL